MSAGRQDWQAWHRDYDDADSPVSRRLVQVRPRLATLLDEADEPVRLLNLCCGDGRDTVPVLASVRPGGGRLSGRARPRPRRRCAPRRRRGGGSGVEVRTGDAAATATYADRLPVDVLLLVGVLGNVSDADAERTIAAAASMVVPGGTVVWSRSNRFRAEPTHGYADPAEWVRDRFEAHGFETRELPGPRGATPGGSGSPSCAGRRRRPSAGDAVQLRPLSWPDPGRAARARASRRTARRPAATAALHPVARAASRCRGDVVGVAEARPGARRTRPRRRPRPGRRCRARRRGRGRRRAATRPVPDRRRGDVDVDRQPGRRARGRSPASRARRRARRRRDQADLVDRRDVRRARAGPSACRRGCRSSRRARRCRASDRGILPVRPVAPLGHLDRGRGHRARTPSRRPASRVRRSGLGGLRALGDAWRRRPGSGSR